MSGAPGRQPNPSAASPPSAASRRSLPWEQAEMAVHNGFIEEHGSVQNLLACLGAEVNPRPLISQIQNCTSKKEIEEDGAAGASEQKGTASSVKRIGITEGTVPTKRCRLSVLRPLTPSGALGANREQQTDSGVKEQEHHSPKDDGEEDCRSSTSSAW